MSVWSALSHCIFRIHIFIGWFNFNAATDYRTKRKALNNSYYFSYIVYFTQLFVLCELSIMVFCHEYHYYSSLLKFCLWRAQNRHATNRWSLQQISKYNIQRAFRTVPKGPKPLLKIFWVGVFIVDHLFGLSIDVIKYMTRLYPKRYTTWLCCNERKLIITLSNNNQSTLRLKRRAKAIDWYNWCCSPGLCVVSGIIV